EVVVVNDGSHDDTRRILDGLHGISGRLTFLHIDQNRGKGYAVRLGLAQARGTIVVIQDADLELDPVQLGMLVQPVIRRESEVVFGSRFITHSRGVPVLTVAANLLLTAFANLLYGSKLTDVETCYKVMRVEVARSLGLTANGFDIDPEIAARLLRAEHRIIELPVTFQPRSRAEGKKIGWGDGLAALAMLLRHRFTAPGRRETRARQTVAPSSEPL
ncbi:MAG: glycosyltransferase family 2 protein, partial [Vicinamibacterales bacterium]